MQEFEKAFGSKKPFPMEIPFRLIFVCFAIYKINVGI